MIDKEDNFNEFLKQKVEESHFEYNEAYWLKAEKLLENAQPKRKSFWWGFGWGVLSLALIGSITSLLLNNNKKDVGAKTQNYLVSNFNTESKPQTTTSKNKQLFANTEQQVTSKVENAVVLNSAKKNGDSVLKSEPSKTGKKQNNYANLAVNKGSKSNENAKNAALTANTNYGAESYFNQVKSLSAPKLPESFANENEENEEEQSKIITIAEPFVLRAKKPSIKDIDVNIVAACESKNTHEWMFSVLAGVSDSRGFEGNTVSSSRIGFGYFGGLRLAYKLNKNWFVGVQPLMYSRGAINTSIETEKTDYDFGANADEFIVKNKALLFAEMPVSIGYRVQRHQISVGAGFEYLVNVKSDVKNFGTTSYTPNQWGYTDGFNRLGSIAVFNYAFNVYNEFWLTMMVQKGFTDLTKASYFTTNSEDKNLNLRIGLQYQFNNQKKKGK